MRNEELIYYAAPELYVLELSVEEGFGGSPTGAPDDYIRDEWS